MSSQRVKKELYETAMTGEKALTSLMYVQMTLYAAKSQKTYARVRSEGRARMRHTGLHMNQYLRAAGKDLESFRNRLKETHLPEELQSKAETFLVQTVHALDVTEKKQMYRRELIGMEEKVKETAEQIEELLKSMREVGVLVSCWQALRVPYRVVSSGEWAKGNAHGGLFKNKMLR